LILEYLEVIPDAGTSLLLKGHPIEIVQMANNAVKTVRIQPNYRYLTTIADDKPLKK